MGQKQSEFHPGEHELEVRKAGLFGGPIDAALVGVSEAFITFKTKASLKFGQRLKFSLRSNEHKDELSGDGLVTKIVTDENVHRIEIIVEKKAKDHDSKIRAMRSWYESDRYKVRESTRRLDRGTRP